MKKNLLLLSFLLLSNLVFSQGPDKISYQAVIRNQAGELIVEKEVGIHITIVRGSTSNEKDFTQILKAKTNKNGLVTFNIGEGGTTTGDFSKIPWDKGPVFLGIMIDPEGGTYYTIQYYSEMLSVPFALYARNSGTSLDKSYRIGTYDEVGRINTNVGPVRIEGKDGLLVKGIVNQGATIEDYSGSGTQPKMFFNPKKSAFRAGTISNEYWNDPNVGEESAAFGRGPLANGPASFASGVFTRAEGFSSFASGNSTIAAGYVSTAMGYFSEARGYGSTALGRSTLASGEYSTALGYRTKAVGHMSTALGDSSEARGLGSMAFGHKNIASGIYSVAMGYNNNTLGNYSVAMGYGSSADKGYNVAIGFQNKASGYYEGSTAIGYQNTASGDGSVALGLNSMASGKWSSAMGRFNTASGQSSFAIGNNSNTVAMYTGSIGNSNTVRSPNSIAIGNKITIPAGFDGSIVLGDNIAGRDINGYLTKNSLTGRFAGGVRFYTSSDLQRGIGISGNDNSWSTISDSTKKENYLPVNGTDFLNRISTMKLGSWNYKGQDPKDFRHYGPMAQEFNQHFGKDQLGKIGNDTLINQSDLAGVTLIALQALIKENRGNMAQVKQLENQITALQQNNEKLKSELSALQNQYETALKNMEKKFETMGKQLALINVQLNNTQVAAVKSN